MHTSQHIKHLYKHNKLKNIPLTNFNLQHLQPLFAHVSIKPLINQLQFHPYFLQQSLRTYLQLQNIHIQSSSPLINPQILHHATLKSVP
ncbi:aldo/keto reductase, partial [Staphylococcus saprophyticus]|uniref:aldo/keto reductase n=1 Tax=Staphylococcus saprophyticus TaxID=29385 RepID=UPI0028CBC09B